MRPPDLDKATQIKILSPVISVGLLLGVFITTLLWLNVPAQVISSLFWVIMAAAGLNTLLILRQPSSRSRWLRLLAVVAAVSLVYLFPEMFRPVCGETPRVFASPSAGCGRCVNFVCEWNYKKHKEWCYCKEWDDGDCTKTYPPSIQAALNCNHWGQANWCAGSLSLDLVATEPQGREVLISGDVDGTVFACPSGTGSANCSIPLPEGAGNVNYLATSATGLTSAGSEYYQHDSIQPQVSGSLLGTSGNNGWYITPVDVGASVSDPLPGSGIGTFEYSLNNGVWESFIGPLNLLDGVHSLNLRATDIAGNLVETSQTIHVDTVTPALDLSLVGTTGANGWYISTVEVNVTASDDGSGLEVFEVSVGGGPWNAFTTPLLFDNGQHTYQFRAIDHAGNLTEVPLRGLGVDTIPPAIDLPASWILGQTVPFKLQDDGSGLAGLRVVIEDEKERYPKVTWDDGLSGNKFKDAIVWNGRFKDGSQAPPDGEYYAWLKVTDNAGNESMQAGQIIVEAGSSSTANFPGIPVSNTEASIPVEPGNAVPQSSFSPVASMPPVTSFGGGSNRAQPSSAQTGKVSFNSGDSSNSPVANSQSGILWGASATAAIGAFSAEYIRRKEAEKAARRTKSAARRERREASNYHQKITDDKWEQLKKRWRQIEQAVQARKQAALNRRMLQKEIAFEIEMLSHLTNAQTQQDATARAKQKAYDAYRTQEVAAHTKITAPKITKKLWWEKSIDWADKHQTEIALTVGVAVGITAIFLSGGIATPLITAAWLAGSAAVAGGAVAIGTTQLNKHYGRPLGKNVWKNIGVAAGAAAVTSGVGLFLFSGGLTSALIKVGNGAAALCANNQTLCSYVEPALKGVDFLEEAGLMIRGAVQTWRGDSLGAAETAHELQMEYMDGGVPGNAIAKELGEEVSEWTTKYGDDVIELIRKYEDDAIDIISKYGDDGIALLAIYGNDAVDIIGAYGEEGITLLLSYGDEAIDVVKEYGTPAVNLLRNLDPNSVEKLLKNLDEDVIEYAMAQGPDAVVALSYWPDDFLEKYGDELALRATQDARALEAALKYAQLDDINTQEAKELLDIIAYNSIQNSGDNLVLGKWISGTLDEGFIGAARADGALFYGTNPGIEEIFAKASNVDPEDLYWAVNNRVLEVVIEQEVRIDYSLSGLLAKDIPHEIDAIGAIQSGMTSGEVAEMFFEGQFPFRMKEVEVLVANGYTFAVDATNNIVHWSKP